MTSHETSTKLFQSSEIADVYIKYRPTYGSPTYGSEVYKTIINLCRENASAAYSLALDVGCGSGQSTVPLATHFRKVMGLDVSPAQISRAPTDLPNLSFRVGPAEDLSFVASGSVDLVTVATALHWLDTQRFYAEVERVLRPGGALVAYSYGRPCVADPQVQDIICYYMDMIRPFWTQPVELVFQQYRPLSLPFPGWRRNESLKMETCWSLDELVGYLSTWSAYHAYMAKNTDSHLMDSIRHWLQAVYQDGRGREREVQVTFAVYMLMGRKPQA